MFQSTAFISPTLNYTSDPSFSPSMTCNTTVLGPGVLYAATGNCAGAYAHGSADRPKVMDASDAHPSKGKVTWKNRGM